MKSFFTIIGLYMLMLSFLPCSDSKECPQKAGTEISSAQNHGDHQHAAENCSPFCLCSCCATSPFNTAIPKIADFKPSFQSKTFSLCNVDLVADMHSPIWQPPRLS